MANNNCQQQQLPEITQVLLTSQGKPHKSHVRNCSKKARHKISTFFMYLPKGHSMALGFYN
jgi:hypothetical protein